VGATTSSKLSSGSDGGPGTSDGCTLAHIDDTGVFDARFIGADDGEVHGTDNGVSTDAIGVDALGTSSDIRSTCNIGNTLRPDLQCARARPRQGDRQPAHAHRA
jgi:hypothetical protein